jgi:hypothetical protein
MRKSVSSLVVYGTRLRRMRTFCQSRHSSAGKVKGASPLAGRSALRQSPRQTFLGVSLPRSRTAARGLRDRPARR